MVDSEADIAEVGADVVDSVGDELAQFLVLEIVGVDLDRLALRPIVAAAVLEFAEPFLLLRIDRYHRLIGRLKRLGLGVDIFKLSVAIGMFAAFLGLAVEMAAIFQFLQEFGNGRGAHLVTHRPKRPRQLVVALGDPSQRPHRIAHRRGLEQSLQVLQKRRVPRRQPRAPPALATHLPGQRAGVPQVLQTASNRASGDLRRTRGGRDPAVAGRLRLGGGTQPSASLVKRGTKRFKSDTEGRFIYHCHDIDAALEDRNPPIPNPIHLFLAVALVNSDWRRGTTKSALTNPNSVKEQGRAAGRATSPLQRPKGIT